MICRLQQGKLRTGAGLARMLEDAVASMENRASLNRIRSSMAISAVA